MMLVQSSLFMFPIHAYGSEAQKRVYLPKLATGEIIGCFGLTEPDAGSDRAGMTTRAVKTADGNRILGGKTWISNAPIADLFLVWAGSDTHGRKVRGFLIDRDTPGVRTPVIDGKLSLRAPVTEQIAM